MRSLASLLVSRGRKVVKRKVEGEPDYAAALADIIDTLSRLRGLVDAAGLPDGDARRNLTTHLALASIAAHELRLGPGDDLIVLDET